jgi:hypothetical protein
MKSKTKTCPLPSNFRPDNENWVYAYKYGLDIDDELFRFECLHGSMGSERRNWQRVFHAYLRQRVERLGLDVKPDWIPREPWMRWVEGLRRPRTRYGFALLVKRLAQLRNEGNDPPAVLQQSIERGWQDVYPLSKREANIT